MIPNPSAQGLAHSLIECPNPTAQEMQKAMDLIYEAGRLDGRLEVVQEELAKITKDRNDGP